MPFSGLRSSVIYCHSAHSLADQAQILLGREHEQKEVFGVSLLPWVGIWAPLFIPSLGKLLNFLKPQFPYLQNGG